MDRILIVEDEKKIASFIEKGFQKNGFHTTVVFDGEYALEVAQAHKHEAILLDLGLSLKDGWTVLKELREHGNDCPVIVVTAREESLQKVLLAGANDYVLKPFKFKDLLTIVQRHLKKEI
ncbi:MAG: response regulator transcription factor [Leptolyngbyaceae cyanobacterium]